MVLANLAFGSSSNAVDALLSNGLTFGVPICVAALIVYVVIRTLSLIHI